MNIVVTCEECGKEYTKRDKAAKNHPGARSKAVRRADTKTCSPRCSSKREVRLDKVRARRKNENT